MSENKHFVLVHGFCHGAWCWYKLAAALKAEGSRITALDLAGCGVRPGPASSFSDYVHPLMDFLSSLPENDRVVLVGHSYGGFPISVAMENFPAKISLAVFITAYMPNCTDPPSSLVKEFLKRSSPELFMDSEFTFDGGGVPVSAIFGPECMAAKLYGNCSPKDLELAKMLIRRNWFFLDELSEKSMVSVEKYGVVKRCYVICEDDEVVDEEFQRFIIHQSPPHEVVSISAAGHMPMLSQTHQLSSCLLQLSQKYS